MAVGPEVLLIPALFLIATGYLFWRWAIGREGKGPLILAGVSALLAGGLVFSYLETEIVLDNWGRLERIQGDPILWFFQDEWLRSPDSRTYFIQFLVAVSLTSWGVGLLLRAFVKGTAMTMLKALRILLASMLLFAAIGCGIGAGLGRFAPNYYRDLYPNGHSPDFDPQSMGLGLGLTQGASAGVVIGLILVAILTRWASKKSEKLFFEEIPLE
jgi:hypothetical protein